METLQIWDSTGQSEYALCRIPGILVSSRGTVIVYYEARRSRGDWAMMDILMRRRTGAGFSAPAALAQGTHEHPTVNNPVMAEDAHGTLHFLYCEDYGTRGGRILHRKSGDDGQSWSAPEDITPATLPHYRNVFALGPGHGICTDAGTLVFPFWLVPKSFGKPENAHVPSEIGVLYSRDSGETWQATELLPARSDIVSPNETAAAELRGGEVYLAIRQNAPARAYAVLKKDLSAFLEYAPVQGLADPVCFGSAAALGEKLLFVNCDHAQKRKNLTLRASRDGGKTWHCRKVIDAERGGYADIAASEERGKIYVIYENNYGEELYLAELNAEEI